MNTWPKDDGAYRRHDGEVCGPVVSPCSALSKVDLTSQHHFQGIHGPAISRILWPVLATIVVDRTSLYTTQSWASHSHRPISIILSSCTYVRTRINGRCTSDCVKRYVCYRKSWFFELLLTTVIIESCMYNHPEDYMPGHRMDLSLLQVSIRTIRTLLLTSIDDKR